MTPNLPPPGDDERNNAHEFLKFLQDPTHSQRMVEGAYENQDKRERALMVVNRALDGTRIDCDTCEGLCDHQAMKIRDAFMARARTLVDHLAVGLRLYEECRAYGVDEPTPIINRIYQAWSELALLHEYAEPQENLADDEDAEEDAEEEGSDA